MQTEVQKDHLNLADHLNYVLITAHALNAAEAAQE